MTWDKGNVAVDSLSPGSLKIDRNGTGDDSLSKSIRTPDPLVIAILSLVELLDMPNMGS